MTRTRAYRRAQRERIVAKRRFVWNTVWGLGESETVGGDGAMQITPMPTCFYTTGQPCSCWDCGNPRRWTGERTRQERKAMLP